MSFDNGISGYCVCCDQSNSHSKECPIAEAIKLLSSNGRFVNTNGNHGGPIPAAATAYDVTSDPRLMNSMNHSDVDLINIKSLHCKYWPPGFPKNKKG